MNKKINLIICMTPLHAIIAESIIHLKKDEVFDLIFISGFNKKKNEFYYNSLKKIVRDSKNICFGGWLDFFLNALFFSEKFGGGHYHGLYFAGLGDKYCHLFYRRLSYVSLFTFDDGFGNINPNSGFITTGKRMRNKLKRFLRIESNVEEIIKKSKTHYSIYRNIKNIFPIVKYVDLSNRRLNQLNEEKFLKFFKNFEKNSVSIFLGQPIWVLNKKFDLLKISEKLRGIDVDYYFPHPSEKEFSDLNIEVIDTDLVVEDFVSSALIDNPRLNVKIYSFFSTALFNLSSIERVNVFSVYDDELIKEFRAAYNVISYDESIKKIKLKE